MSKAALFAGLGQGLMAAGQSFGRAFENMSIEKLRQQNIEKNWAREDRLRAEDNAREDRIRAEEITRQDKIRSDDLEYRKGRDAATDAYRTATLDNQRTAQEATAEYQRAALENQAEMQRLTKEYQIETQKARTAAANAATVEARAKATQDLIKIQDDQYSKIVSPLDKQLEELNKTLANDSTQSPEDRERLNATILKLKEDRAYLVENLFGEGAGVEGSIGYREAKMISGLRAQIPEETTQTQTTDEGDVSVPVETTLAGRARGGAGTPAPVNSESAGGLMGQDDSKKKYGGVSLGEATGVTPLVGSLSEGLSNWASGNDVLTQAWENPKAIDSMSAEQLQMLISRRGDDNRWSSRITRARARLAQFQG